MLLLLCGAARSAGRPALPVPEHGAFACPLPVSHPPRTACSRACPVAIPRSPSSPGHLCCSCRSGKVPRSFWILLGSGVVGANVTFPFFAAALPRSAVQTLFPALWPWALFWGSPLLSVLGAIARGLTWQKPAVAVKGMVWAQKHEIGAGGSRAASPCARSADTEPPQGLWGAGTPQSLGLGSCLAGWAVVGSSSPFPPPQPHLAELGAGPTPATAFGFPCLSASLGASPGLCCRGNSSFP